MNILWKRHIKSLKFILAATGMLYLAPDLQAHIDERGYGLNPISQEAFQDAEENWHTIVEVKPNKVGLERIQHHREENGLSRLFMSSATPEDEFVQVKGQNNALAHETFEAPLSLPSSVDNSQLPSFPPIGDQKQLGSCVAWGTTYYQATHEYGLLNGLNNKTSLKTVFSPKWTYNNLNGGYDQGLNIFDSYQLFSQNGVVSIERFPYDSNYREWDLNVQDWISAISYRTSPGQLISGIGGAQQNLEVIKQLLNNGHVLTFGTFIESWQMTKVKKDPASSNNAHVGESVASWMNGTYGGHCMTIVGYDDDIWVDINNDGKVDAGEKGAFLIANSWGTNWGNKGFVWVAYDAFLTKSAVVNGPRLGRVGIADAMNSYVVSAVPIARQYSPQLIAQFTLSQSLRNQISVSVGISDVKSTTPSKVFSSYAVVNKGGKFEFDGTSPHGGQTASFALDLTDLLSVVPADDKRFYLIVNDNLSGNPTTVQSFSIIDPATNKVVAGTNAPISVDNTSKMIYVDYSPTQKPPTPAPTPTPVPIAAPTLNVTSPINNQIVRTNVWLAANAVDKTGIDRVEFYIDSKLFATDNTAPYYVLLSTQTLARGQHTLTVIAYNKHGASTAQTTSFCVTR